MQEIEQYKSILPVLKYVRGEIFSDQHWNEMFGLLCMPRKGISELKFKDFLDVKHKLIEHSQVSMYLFSVSFLVASSSYLRVSMSNHNLLQFDGNCQ